LALSLELSISEFLLISFIGLGTSMDESAFGQEIQCSLLQHVLADNDISLIVRVLEGT